MKTLVVVLAQVLPLLVPAVAAVVWFTLPRASKIGLGAQAVIALVVVLGLIQVAAALHTDPRPFAVDPSLTPFFAHPADNGFPSDHTALASTVAFLVMRYRTRLGVILLTASIIGGAARVIAHVHHTQDIVAGVLIAALAVAAAAVAWRWVDPRLPGNLLGEDDRRRRA
ncbi:putative undecaprenyl-diphosphatase YbjG [mine drainage metagenome]|uniref:Putative undecaprenyl-diphosphatase YbjG n=1 Tax=mine drainage metagenome TaxID=410659 RepID=A0A1J5QDY3_9ZZZZ